ncbi:MAG: nucleotidyltransferase domain-containing protein [Thermodesulforhabdaceae bacterium]
MDIYTQKDLKEFLKSYFSQKGISVKIVLFGSRARGQNEPYSDIDLALISDADLTGELVELKGIVEESNLPYKVDIVIFEKLPPEMKEEILKEGKVWVDLKS